MLFGRIVGTVVSTRKDEKIEGLKLQVVETLDIKSNPTNNYVVAVDAVGAGVGEIILYSTGSSARQTILTHEKPCDAVIMAIVDSWDVNNEIIYTKDTPPAFYQD